MATALFDDLTRTDPKPARQAESSFAFLNRVDQPFWARVRDAHEDWFREYTGDRRDLRARFRSSAPEQHFGAWWELYLFTLFTRLGFVVETHPKLADVSRRPDFRLRRDDDSFLVEAMYVQSGLAGERRSGAREAWVVDPINALEHPNFFVGLSFDHAGTVRPGTAEVVAGITDWLDGLNPDRAGDYERRTFTAKDWKFTLTAFPVKPEARARRRDGLIGIHSPVSGWVQDAGQLRKSLRGKAQKYGTPSEPFLLAPLMMSGFADTEDVAEALLGDDAVRISLSEAYQPVPIRRGNGFWVSEHGIRGTRISGLLVGSGLQPWSLVSVLPALWLNPFATHPLLASLPFQTNSWDAEGVFREGAPSAHAADVLGLPADWPGPEAPFPRVDRDASESASR